MPKFMMASLVNAKPGADRELTDWLGEIHLPEVVENGGFIKARCLRLIEDLVPGQPSYRYLILYEGECADPVRALDQLNAAHAEQKIQPSEALDPSLWVGLFEEMPFGEYHKKWKA